MPEQAETQPVDTETAPTPAPSPTQKIEAAEDAWLSANIADSEPSAVHDPGDETDHEQTKTPPKPGDTTEAEGTDTTASDGDTATDSTDDDLAKAISALRREAAPQELIDSLLESEGGLEKLKTWGLKRAKVQADVDRKLSQSKRSETDPVESQTEQASAGDTAPQDEPRKDNLAEAVEWFKNEFGDEAGEAFEKFSKATVDDAEQRIQRRYEQVDGDNKLTRAYAERIMLQDARKAVANDFPQLKDDEAYRSVEAKVRSLVKTGDYQDAETAMRDAALLTFGPETLSRAKNALNQSRRLKNAGSPTVKTHKAPVSSMSREQAEDAALDLILEGNDPDTVRRALRS